MPEDSENWIVLKFGGTSVSSRDNWERIVKIVESRIVQNYRVCVIHSALSGISDKLQEIAKQAETVNPEQLFDEIKKRHLELADELEVNGKDLLKEEFEELGRLIKGINLIGEISYRTEARILAMGELMSTKLGAAFLSKSGLDFTWMDARNLLKTVPRSDAAERANILSAVCDTERDPALISNLEELDGPVITQGFIAGDNKYKTVLLGRGGSDVSAAYFAAKLQAEKLEIWTDVPGMFSANPHMIPSARLLKQLSYEEAQEIATNGAKVLHPRSILPVRLQDIPLHVKYTARPELEGTVISSAGSGDEALVKAVAVRNEDILVSMESLGMWQQVGFLADAFDVFRKFGLSIDLISTSESNVTVSLDPGLNAHFRENRNQFVRELSTLCQVRIIESASAISLLGRHIRAILSRLTPVFELFREHEIHLVSQAANDLNFTFVTESQQADRLVRQIHDQVISQTHGSDLFGATWQQIVGREEEEDREEYAWWRDKSVELINIARDHGPVFVYSSDVIKSTIQQLKSMKSLDRVFYAIKANANKDILRIVYEYGLGFETVSIGEVKHVLELFPEIDRDRILFTPNFAPKSEYEEALKSGVFLTLDNSFTLLEWPDLFEGEEIFLRIDPGHGHGHHKHVRTGGMHSKFGIPMFELEEVAKRITSIGAKVKGLHAHLGSGIKDPGSWKSTALRLAEAADYFDGVKILDVGGGLGIRENELQSALDLELADRALMEFREGYPQYQIWMEPGRYIVASAGALLARITQLKGKGEVQYVGLETGMNSFIRPALYGAHHSIVNLSKMDRPADRLVNVVGPICESGDKLGIERLFPESEEGDVVLIANTGAYGRVMASAYNMREPAGEIVI